MTPHSQNGVSPENTMAIDEYEQPTTQNIGATEVNSNGAEDSGAHGIFDERFRLFADPFGDTCEREGVSTAILIVADPKMPRQPIVFLRGNKYDAAKLVASLLRQLQQQILNDISTH